MPLTRRLWYVQPGNAGIIQTVERMMALSLPPSPLVVETAEQLVRPLPAHAGSQFWRAALIYQWVQDHLVYTPDATPVEDTLTHVGGEALDERLRSPDYLLRWIARDGRAPGDCDDFVMLMGALWTAVGLEVRVVLTSADYATGEFDHVFASVLTERGWLAADAIHGEPFGWSLVAAAPERIANYVELPFSTHGRTL